MQNNTATHWYEVWIFVLIAVISATGGIVGTLLTRKKPSLSESEEDKNRSEARLDRAQAREAEGRLSMSLLDKLGETQKTITFLEQELQRRGDMETIARNQKHRALGEVERCMFTIHDYEESMHLALAAVDLLIEDCADDAKRKPLRDLRDELRFSPFKVRNYSDMIGGDLPLQSQVSDSPIRLALPSAS